jgi:hypothetical protein
MYATFLNFSICHDMVYNLLFTVTV